MAGKARIPWPTDTEFAAGVARCGTGENYRQELRETIHYPVSRGAFDHHWRGVRMRERIPSGAGGGAMPPAGREVSSEDPAEWSDIPGLLERRGLSLDDWVIVRVRVNEWGEDKAGEPLGQLRVDLEPKSLDSLMPARSDGWRAPLKTVAVSKSEAELVVFFGDQHAPHHEPALHAAACDWLRRNKPSRGILLGDLIDYDTLSRHRRDPKWTRKAQDCVDAGYSIVRGFVEASPGTRWQMLSGNHEDRMRNSVIDHLLSVYGLSRAHRPEDESREEAVLSVIHLLRLDELGVEWVGSDGEYAHEQIKVSNRLAARHGWIARKGSGSSAAATLDHLRYSCVIGHCHRQSIVFHTAHDIDGGPLELQGVEAGTMARIDGGLGYAPSPDWQQGFATARIWPDGFFSTDLAKFIDGSLVWANQRYTPEPTVALAA